MEQVPSQEQKSEFRTLDQVTLNEYGRISDGIKDLEQSLRVAGESMAFDRAGNSREQMQGAFFKAHEDYLSVLRRAERWGGELQTMMDYNAAIQAMRGAGVRQDYLDVAKQTLDGIRGDAIEKLEAIIRSPAGQKIIEIAEEKEVKGIRT